MRCTTGLFALILASAGCGEAPPPETEPGNTAAIARRLPNVVLIFVDDMGTEIGAYGDPVVQTPNIDRLANEGVLFERAYTVTPSCSASRAALLTGRYPHTNGVMSLIQWHKKREDGRLVPELLERTRRHSLKHDEILLSQHLKRLGYRTGILGKWHISLDPVTEWGFDEYWAEPEEFIPKHRDEPFFYYYAPFHTHVPFWTSPEFVYDPSEIPVPPYFRDHPDLRADLADYYSAISNQDQEIGRILDTLDREGLADDTIVVFSSDNGPPYARAKGTLYEWGIREPLLIRYPRELPPDTRTETLATTVDVYPTILELLGQPIPERLQGASLVDAMKDPDAQARDAIFTELSFHALFNPMRSVRSTRWKYIRNFDPNAPFYTSLEALGLNLLETPLPVPPRPREELYDLEADPLESTNLAASLEHAGTLVELRQRLVDWMERTGDIPLAEADTVTAATRDRGAWYGRPDDPAPNSRQPRPGLNWDIIKERLGFYAGVPEEAPEKEEQR